MRPEAKAVLSPRQQEIARLISRGLQDKQIAEELGISAFTVDHYLRSAYRRLGVNSRPQFVFKCFSSTAWPLEARKGAKR
jgi:DNA-binding CsgD family transcriptional regulator